MRFSNYIDKLLSSNEPQKCPVLKQIVGAIFSVIREHRLIALFAVCVILGIAGALYRRLGCLPCLFSDGAQWGGYGWAILSVLIICICALVNGVAIKLTPIFNLRKQSDKSTRAQITILLSTSLSAILLLVIFLVAFGISKDSPVFIPVSILGAVLGWIYQDTLKSVAAYLYLARMDKLHIDDWIEVKSIGIDGEVQSISLTSVEIRNWDTTVSLFPTYILLENNFQNHQPMVSGRTLGRQMTKVFTIDTGWIHPLKSSELELIKDNISPDLYKALISTGDIKKGRVNLHAFRSYLYNYLMMHDKVSHEPRLLVRLVEHSSGGIRMQIYAYITETELMAFEEEQSLIIEHVVESISWFGLRLYQSPRGGNNDGDEEDLVIEEENYEQE